MMYQSGDKMTIGILSSYLVVSFVFIVFVLRALYYFSIKEDPLKALKIKMPKIPKGSLLALFKKEKKEEDNSKWA